MIRRVAATALLVTAVVAGAGCGSSEPARRDVVGTLTTTVAPAAYTEFEVAVAAIAPTVTAWCETGDPTAASAAVADARAAWTRLAPFRFGPSSDRRSMFIIDPRSHADEVEALVSGDQPVDATSLRELAGGDQRGLGSLDVLLATPPDGRRCDYAHGLVDLLQEEATALVDAWDAYGAEVSADDEAANIALRDIVSQSLFEVRMAVTEPDDPLNPVRLAGVRTALLGDADQPGITELLSDETVERLTAELDAGDAPAAEITITTSVVGELGTTVNFSDADGDG